MKKSKNKMNREQKDFLAHYTCEIIERYENIDNVLKTHGIPKTHIKKLNKALDMIFEVNQCCFNKK